ncbi:MAG: O-antigen ligase family protein [Stenotrophomonas sp.]
MPQPFSDTAPGLAQPVSASRRWLALHRSASLGLLLLLGLVLSTPTNLLPFGVVLLFSSLLGADYLCRARALVRPYLGALACVALAVIALGLWSAWHFDQVLDDVDNRSRFLVMPWAMLWVCALRPAQQSLWWGALLGLLATAVIAVMQVVGGVERAEGWTNAIVLADTTLVLMVVLVLCRPPQRWGLIMLGMVAGGTVILLSGSRGVWPALLMLLLAMALSVPWRNGRFRLAILASMVTVAGTLVLAVPELREMTRLDELHSDVQRIERGDVNSSAGARLERLQVAWATVQERPWTGIGIGHFDNAMERLPVCRPSVQQAPRCDLGHAHNDLAEWAATMGLPGAVLLLIVYGLPLWLFTRLHRRSGESGFRGPAAAGILVVGTYVLCGLTQSMFAHQITASVYTTLVGVLAGLSLLDAAQRRRPASQD